MAKFCSNCGEKFTVENPKFCPSCGEAQASAASTSSVTTPPRAEVPTEPFYPFYWDFTAVTPEGYTDGVFEFGHSNKLIVEAQAAHWLSEDTLSSKEILQSAGSNFDPGVSDDAIHRAFTRHNQALDGFTPIPWADSVLGQRFLKVITDLGVSFGPMHIGFQLSYTDENNREVVEPIGEQYDWIAGTWGTSDGQPYLQIGRVYKSEATGEEKIYWHIEALARTRYPLADREPHFSNLVMIPSLLQSVFYVCETKFPSSLVTMPRSMAFEVDHEKTPELPQPYIQTQRNARATYIDKANLGQVLTFVVPELTRLGYIITENYSEEDLKQYIPTMFDTLMRIPNVLLDGFANWDIDSQVPFQGRLGADIAFMGETPANRCGFMVPAFIYGKLSWRTKERYNAAFRILMQGEESKNMELIDKSIDEFMALATFGVGEVFAHATNTLANTVIELKNSASDAFGEMIEYISRYPIDFQDVNALSNLARFHIKMGRIPQAEAVIDRAITRVDSGFEAVVNQTNSLSWNTQGETEIIEEIYETYFSIKSQLGKLDQCRAIAPKAKEFCEKNGITGGLFETARSYLS